MGRDGKIYSSILASGKQKYFYLRGLTEFLVTRSDLPVGWESLKPLDNLVLAQATTKVVIPAKAGIQYAAARRFIAGVSGILGRPVKPGDDTCGCGPQDETVGHHPAATTGSGGCDIGKVWYRTGRLTGR
jgi:hypothetical protein